MKKYQVIELDRPLDQVIKRSNEFCKIVNKDNYKELKLIRLKYEDKYYWSYGIRIEYEDTGCLVYRGFTSTKENDDFMWDKVDEEVMMQFVMHGLFGDGTMIAQTERLKRVI